MAFSSKRILSLQGAFYVLTGLWPIISISTFEAVTGPKTDKWLVKTVGGLITAVGASFLYAGLKKDEASSEIVLAATASAAALATADVVYASRGRISKVYLLDAVAEALTIALLRKAVKYPQKTTAAV